MCLNWFKKQEPQEDIMKPEKGIVLFAWDESFYQVINCHAKNIRFITNDGYNFQDSTTKISWLISHGFNVLINVNSIPLAESLSSIFGNKVSMQWLNEVNSAPHGDITLNPVDYMATFKQFERIVRNNGSGCVMSGLNCEDKNVKSWFRGVIPLGIREATDKYVLHHYSNVGNYKNILSYMRKTAPEKEIIIGEYGNNTNNEELKNKSLDTYISRFSSDKITKAYLYAWGNGENWGIHNQPNVLSHFNSL